MEQLGNIKVLFIAGFGPIVREATASRKLYNQILGIGFKEENDGYLHTEALKGAKSFALWPLSQAAHSCFGEDSWPHEIPAPRCEKRDSVSHAGTPNARATSRANRRHSGPRRAHGPTVPGDAQRKLIDRTPLPPGQYSHNDLAMAVSAAVLYQRELAVTSRSLANHGAQLLVIYP